MSKILIFGGCGYIGLPVIRHFVDHGYEVVVVDNFIYGHQITALSNLMLTGVSFINIDFCNEDHLIQIGEQFDSFSTILMLGGLVGDPITKKFPKEALKINSHGVRAVLEFCLRRFPDSRLVFVSTCSNYGLLPENEIADETTALKPLSLYAKAKVEQENWLLSRMPSQVRNIVILRFATAFGLAPRMRFDLTVNQFTRALCIDEELLVFDPDTWRPYCHVNDFAELFRLVADASADLVGGQIFNVGSDVNNATKRDLINLISKRVSSGSVKYVDGGSDPRNYRVSFTKIQKILGFKPSVSLEEGIDEIAWMVNKGFFGLDVSSNIYGNYGITE